MFKSIIPLSLIISLRFFGLFIVLPIISIYSLNLDGATPYLVGLVVGGYALTQMSLQIPFGVLSDKIGRKKTIFIGLLIFIIGSIISGFAQDIYWMIFGRFLQGAGAIGAVVTAYISDLTTEELRPKAMAIMGAMIGLSFALSMLLGPILSSIYGVESLFLLTAFLSFISILILFFMVKDVNHIDYSYNNKNILSTKELLLDKNLSKMNITNFLQKGFMTATFVIIPIIMVKDFGLDKSELFKVYIPAMILGLLAMGPASIIAQKRNKFRELLIVGVSLFILSFSFIAFNINYFFMVVGVTIFFIGFNIHEPIMQSLTTRFISANQRGKALGIFNSFGYGGTFIGGIAGSLAISLSFESILSIFIVISLVWILLLIRLDNPKVLKSLYLSCEDYDISKANSLNGVDEIYLNRSENLIVLKFQQNLITEESIRNSIVKDDYKSVNWIKNDY